MFEDSVHQYHVDESLEPSENEPTVLPEPPNNIQADVRAWASVIKYVPEPITSVPPSRVVSSLDPPDIETKTTTESKKEPSKASNIFEETSMPVSKPIKQEVISVQP